MESGNCFEMIMISADHMIKFKRKDIVDHFQLNFEKIR